MNFRSYSKLITIAVVVLIILLSSACRGTNPVRGWSGPKVEKGILYVGILGGKVKAYDISKGDLRNNNLVLDETLEKPRSKGGFLSCAPPLPTPIYGTPAIDGDTLFIGTYDGIFYAINMAALNVANKLIWRYPQAGKGEIGPIVGGTAVHKGVVYFGSSDGKVYSLDATNGLEKGAFQTGKKVWSTPVVKDNKLFVSSFDGYLYAFDLKKGVVSQNTLLWKFKANGAIAATPLIENNTIYIGSFDSHLYAIDANTGKVKWSFTGGGWFWDYPAIKDNILIAGNIDHKIYALDARTGNDIWSYETQGSIRASPVIIGDTVVIASEDSNIYFLKISTGNLIRVIPVGSPVLANPVTHDGIIFIHTQDGVLIAFDADKGIRVGEVTTTS